MRVNKNSLSAAILESLQNSESKALKVNHFSYHSDSHIYLDRANSHLPKQAVLKAVERLKAKNLVEVVDSENLEIRITEGGDKLIQENREIRDDSFVDWDGKLRVVLFDIPENKRVIRNLFRRNLKRWGFKNYQRSVWVSKRDTYQQVVEYIQLLDIESWVIIFESDHFYITPS